MKDCLFSGLVGCGRFHQFGYRILTALSWGSTIDTHPLRDMNRPGGGKHPAVSEVHRARDLLFAHCEPDDLTVVSVLRGTISFCKSSFDNERKNPPTRSIFECQLRSAPSINAFSVAIF